MIHVYGIKHMHDNCIILRFNYQSSELRSAEIFIALLWLLTPGGGFDDVS